MKYKNIVILFVTIFIVSCKKESKPVYVYAGKPSDFFLILKAKDKPIETPQIYLDDSIILQGGVSYFELLGTQMQLIDSVSVHGSCMPYVLIDRTRIIGLFACDIRTPVGICKLSVFAKTGQVFDYQFYVDTLDAGVRDMGSKSKDTAILSYNKACVDTAKMFSPRFFYFDHSFDTKILEMEITSPFGRKRIYHTKSSTGADSVYASRHLGTDLRSKRGQRFYAPNDCVVTFTDILGGGWGKIMIVDYGNNIFQAFLHLDKFYFEKGDFVSKGEPLGETGASGLPDVKEAHLHSTFSFGAETISTFSAISEINYLYEQAHRYNNLRALALRE